MRVTADDAWETHVVVEGGEIGGDSGGGKTPLTQLGQGVARGELAQVVRGSGPGARVGRGDPTVGGSQRVPETGGRLASSPAATRRSAGPVRVSAAPRRRSPPVRRSRCVP